jgi:hypothetical protein
MSTKRPPGLKTLTAMLLGASLDKTQQVSDWAARPLTGDQLSYAATDAWVLFPLARAMAELPPPPAGLQHTPVPRRTGLPASGDGAVGGARGVRAGEGNYGVSSTAARALASPPERGRGSKEDWRVDGRLSNTLSLSPVLVDSAAAVGQMPPACEPTGFLCPVGSRQAAMQMCGGDAARTAEVRPCGNGGVTRFGDGYVLMLNTADSAGGKYRNDFWRESDGSLCFSWFPSRGQSLAHRSCQLLLYGEARREPVEPETAAEETAATGHAPALTRLLFARRRSTAPFFHCGRLEIAVVIPSGDPREGVARLDAARQGVPCWQVAPPSRAATSGSAAAPPQGPHVVWRLLDGDELLRSAAAADALFGCGMAGGVWPLIREEMPEWYSVDEKPE